MYGQIDGIYRLVMAEIFRRLGNVELAAQFMTSISAFEQVDEEVEMDGVNVKVIRITLHRNDGGEVYATVHRSYNREQAQYLVQSIDGLKQINKPSHGFAKKKPFE